MVIGQDIPPIGDAGGAPIWKLHELEWSDGAPPQVAITRDDVAEIIFTSGATADPKGVIITHRNVLANIVPVEHEVLEYRRWGTPFFPLRFLNLLPLSHMFGQAMATFVPPMLPGVVVFMRGYNPGDIVAPHQETAHLGAGVGAEDSRRAAATARSFGVGGPEAGRRPALTDKQSLRAAVVALSPNPVVSSGLRTFWSFVVGAAPSRQRASRGSGRELGYVVVRAMVSPKPLPSSRSITRSGRNEARSARPIAGVEVKIAPDGEILVRGENVTRGYFNAAEKRRGRSKTDGSTPAISARSALTASCSSAGARRK